MQQGELVERVDAAWRALEGAQGKSGKEARELLTSAKRTKSAEKFFKRSKKAAGVVKAALEKYAAQSATSVTAGEDTIGITLAEYIKQSPTMPPELKQAVSKEEPKQQQRDAERSKLDVAWQALSPLTYLQFGKGGLYEKAGQAVKSAVGIGAVALMAVAAFILLSRRR